MRGSGDHVHSSQLSRLPQQIPHQLPTPPPAPPPTPVTLPGAAYPDWEAIYSDNVSRIYRLMFSKVGNRPDAEDLTSQVFLTAYSPLRTTAGMAQVRAYLTATARTVLAEHWRRTLGHQVTEIDPLTIDLADYADVGHSPTDAHSPAEEHAARILEALPQRQRQVLVLRFLRGYSIRQAATELGVTIANAKVLQHRALRAAAGLGLDAREQHGRGDGHAHAHGDENMHGNGDTGRDKDRDRDRDSHTRDRAGRKTHGHNHGHEQEDAS